MAKFLIQDIMPPEKRKRVSSPVSRSTRPALQHTVADEPETLRKSHQVEYSHNNNNTEDVSDVVLPDLSTQREFHDSLQHSSYSVPITADEPPEMYIERKIPKRPGSANGDARVIPWKLISIIAGTLTVFIVGASYFFSGTTVFVEPKSEHVLIDNDINAEKTPTGNALAYSALRITLEETMEVPATGTKTVTAKASGKIIIYNETKSQRLIKNTRFESPKGKIYRIAESITVPGTKVVSGKNTPGSLEVTVYADEPGPEYNTDPVDFTIPGLKEDARFTQIYARSKGPISGGAAGITKTVAPEELTKAQQELQVRLETKLRAKLQADVSEKQIVYPTGIFAVFEEPSLVDVGVAAADKATVKLSGSLTAIAFDRTQLAQAVATIAIPGYAKEPITVTPLDNMIFTTQEGTTAQSVWEEQQLTFHLNGTTDITWDIDVNEIKNELAGVKKSIFNSIMTGYHNVEQARARVRPDWKDNFPTSVDEIDVVIEEPSTE